MITGFVSACEIGVGFFLGVIFALLMQLFFSNQVAFGLFLTLMVISGICAVWLLESINNRIGTAIFKWIGLATPDEPAKAKHRWLLWGAIGFCAGLAASLWWTPTKVMAFFAGLGL
jgi:hypothetical protein